MLATAQNPESMTALHRIQAAGYRLRLAGDVLQVSPADKLTGEQRDFIASHKAELIAALVARVSTEGEPVTAVEAVAALQRSGFAVTVKGDSLIVEPADELTEAQRGFIGKLSWAMVQLLSFGTLESLTKPNIQADPGYVCCFECLHSQLAAHTEPRNGWRRCGLDLPNGGGFAQQLRRCAEWESAL